MSDIVYFGSAVKAIEDEPGKVGGYLVMFTDASQKDLDGEYFTKSTYFGARAGDGVDVMFHHGRKMPNVMRLPAAQKAKVDAFSDHIFSQPVKTKTDEVGIWAETVLNLADEYEKAVYDLVAAGKMSWSSGAVSHLVKKEPDGKITRWPIGEASLTPTPAQPRQKVTAVKSLDDLSFVDVFGGDGDGDPTPILARPKAIAGRLCQLLDDQADDGADRVALAAKLAREASLDDDSLRRILTGETAPTAAHLKAFARVLRVDYATLKATADQDAARTIKGMFADALAAQTPSRWQLECVYSDVIEKIAEAAEAAQMVGLTFDYAAKVREATAEYTAILQANATAQIGQYLQADGEEDFYFKAALRTEDDFRALSGLPLEDHSSVVVSAARGIAARFRGNQAARVKSGRVLSDKNRTRITALLDQLKAVGADLQALLDESTPAASASDQLAAKSQFLRLQARIKKLGV